MREAAGVATGRTSAGRTRRVALAALASALVVAPLACTGERERERQVKEMRSEMARSESTATRAAERPSTGLWDEAHLLDRLVHTGVAPRKRADALAGPPWMGTSPLAFVAGGGELYVWIYRDSTARRAVTDGLDPATAAPQGAIPPFAAPMVFVTQNNLAAVVTGGSVVNQERIALALQAGLPVSTGATARAGSRTP